MRLLKNKTLYAGVMIFIIWYIVHLALRSAIVPNPYQTVVTFFKLLPGVLLLHLLTSLARIATAVFISLTLGVALRLLIGMNSKVDKLVTPIIYLLYPVPKIAFLPVFMVLFGLGNLSKIILITVIIIFQIIVTTRDSVKGLSKELFYSVRSLGLNKIQTYRHLIFPAILPKIITALRISVGTSIAVLFFGENFATRYGIGYFIMNSWITVDYVEMFSGILALSLMGLGLFKLIDYIESKLCVWVKVSKLN